MRSSAACLAFITALSTPPYPDRTSRTSPFKRVMSCLSVLCPGVRVIVLSGRLSGNVRLVRQPHSAAPNANEIKVFEPLPGSRESLCPALGLDVRRDRAGVEILAPQLNIDGQGARG